MNSSRKGFNRFALAAFAVSACIAFAVQAQMPDPNMQPPPQPPPKQNPFKQLFAGTLSAVLQTTGVGLATGLTQVMTGAIQNWFNKAPKAPANVVADPAAGMGGMGAMPTGMPAGMTDPMAGMQSPGGMPGAAPDPMGGMSMPPPAPMGGGMPMTGAPMGMQPSTPPAIYAGLAYEVQLLSRTGETMTVDPATHVFATGDRFVVMYRPSLPGQVALYNTTYSHDGRPLGPEKIVDTVNVAAGELTRLGPYEFRNNQGQEALRLLLTACRNEQLMATTRDIVKVDDAPVAAQPAAAPPAINFQNCSNVSTRSVDGPQPRDIVKVSSEEGTMFALDPVSPQEIQAGNIAPRELTLTFNHR